MIQVHQVVWSVVVAGTLASLRLLPLWVFFVLCVALVVRSLFTGQTKAFSVQGKTCLVTGASSGIGAALAHECAKRGASIVWLVARTTSALNGVAQSIRNKHPTCQVHVITCDVSDPDQVKNLPTKVFESSRVRTPDVIFNNAGSGQWRHIEEETPETLTSTMTCPYLAAAHVTRAFIEGFIKRKSGHIVNVTSAASNMGFRGAVGYQTARWAMRGFTESLRADLLEVGVGVTLLNPFETEDTAYFKTAGAESHLRIPFLFSNRSPLAFMLSTTSEQVAVAALDGVQSGAREVLSPTWAHYAAFTAPVMPEIFEWTCRLGPNGLRSQAHEQKKSE